MGLFFGSDKKKGHDSEGNSGKGTRRTVNIEARKPDYSGIRERVAHKNLDEILTGLLGTLEGAIPIVGQIDQLSKHYVTLRAKSALCITDTTKRIRIETDKALEYLEKS